MCIGRLTPIVSRIRPAARWSPKAATPGISFRRTILLAPRLPRFDTIFEAQVAKCSVREIPLPGNFGLRVFLFCKRRRAAPKSSALRAPAPTRAISSSRRTNLGLTQGGKTKIASASRVHSSGACARPRGGAGATDVGNLLLGLQRRHPAFSARYAPQVNGSMPCTIQVGCYSGVSIT